MKKIIVPVDGSVHANLAIEKAKEFAEAFGSSIVLLNIYAISSPTDALFDKLNEPNTPQGHSKLILDMSKDMLKEFGDRVETVSLGGDPAKEIIEYVEASDADLVIMGSLGISGIQRFLIGSVTNKVIHHINKPILVVR